MPTITQRGDTYRIRSYCGYDAKGKQVTRSTTWRPTPGMTPRQIEKELQRQAVLFEEKCSGQGWGGNAKFETFAKQWFQEYAAPTLRPRTVDMLHQLEERTYTAIGHLRLDKLSARHVQGFINNLGEGGIPSKAISATPRPAFLAAVAARGEKQKDIAAAVGLSRSTVSSACRGEAVTVGTAEKLADYLGGELRGLFTVKKGNATLSPKTIKNYQSFISSVMSYAVRMGMVAVNPCERVTLPAMGKREKECYTLEEAQHFLDTLQGAPLKYQAFFALAIYGGFRRGEILGLEWADIDFNDRVVHINRTSQYTKSRGVFTDTTKTAGSIRFLKLPACVFDVLKKHRADQAQERLLMGDQWQEGTRLFVSSYGEPMHPNTPYHWLSRFCEETGQRFLGVHMFRHLNATLLINGGVDAKTVSVSLGHTQVSTTLNIYAHTFAEAQARAGETVADALALGANRKSRGTA